MSLFLQQDRFGEIYHHISCSPVDPLQWMGAVRMRVQTADKNITIIHMTFLIVNSAGSVHITLLIQTGLPFHWRKQYHEKRIHILSGNNTIQYCFLQMCSFWLHKMLVDGLEWCGLLVDYCEVFISCLDSHSDGTHSLQRIHWWVEWYNAAFLQICSH